MMIWVHEVGRSTCHVKVVKITHLDFATAEGLMHDTRDVQ
jgi:hypothetical protein